MENENQWFGIRGRLQLQPGTEPPAFPAPPPPPPIRFSPALVLLAIGLVACAWAQLGTQGFPIPGMDRANGANATLADFVAADTSFSQPGILPTDPLYFAKRLIENVRLLLASGADQKAALHMEFAGTRLAEARALLQNRETGAGIGAMGEYENELSLAAAERNQAAGRLETLGQEGAQHLAQTYSRTFDMNIMELEFLEAKAPAEASQALEHALKVSVGERARENASAAVGAQAEAAIAGAKDSEMRKVDRLKEVIENESGLATAGTGKPETGQAKAKTTGEAGAGTGHGGVEGGAIANATSNVNGEPESAGVGADADANTSAGTRLPAQAQTQADISENATGAGAGNANPIHNNWTNKTIKTIETIGIGEIGQAHAGAG